MALVGTELLSAIASRVLSLLPYKEVFNFGNLVFQRHKLLLRYVLLLLVELHCVLIQLHRVVLEHDAVNFIF